MGEVFKRLPATRLWIEDVLSGNFAERESMPSEFVTDGQPARVALCGIIVDISNDSISMDDGTGVISLRSFDMPAHATLFTPGTPVMVIGKPRKFMNSIYFLIEIVKQLPDVRWLEVWKKTVQRQVQNTTDTTTVLIELIRADDAGADIDKIIKTSGVPDCETKIADMLLKGIIFEVSPGRIKVLE